MSARPRRILVQYDGSSASRRALDAVADLAGSGSAVAVLSVAPGADDPTAARRRLVDEAREVLLRRHVAARCFAAAGDPGESLLEIASNLDIDLLVVAQPSAATSAVLDRAECDVLFVA